MPSNLKLWCNFLSISAGTLLFWFITLQLDLTATVLTLLLIYTLTQLLAKKINHRFPKLKSSTLIATLLLLGFIVLIFYILGHNIGDKEHNHLNHLSQQLTQLLAKIQNSLPEHLKNHLPNTLKNFHDYTNNYLAKLALFAQEIGEHTIKIFTHSLIGIIIGAIMAIQYPITKNHNYPLAQNLHHWFTSLLHCFNNVFLSQIKISIINTALTALYLFILLPLFHQELPLKTLLLVLTFFIGLLPIIGNLISNSIILLLSLTISLQLAGASLLWLIFIHKLEYFLNAKIIGEKIQSKAWEILLMILVCEALFGLSGLIIAPIAYAQLKQSLKKAQLL